jgi:hypothetical protein
MGMSSWDSRFVSNGLPLTKLHPAFVHLIGIDP